MSDDGNLEGGAGIASLREAHEKLQKELKAAHDELSGYRAEKRSQTVAEILKAKGANPAAAKLYTGEDTSEGAVGKWLEDNADVFGVVSNGAPDPNAQNAQRVADASFGNVQSIQNGPGNQVVLGDPESIQHAIDTLSYDELVKLGYMPPRGQLFTPPAR